MCSRTFFGPFAKIPETFIIWSSVGIYVQAVTAGYFRIMIMLLEIFFLMFVIIIDRYFYIEGQVSAQIRSFQ